MLALMPALMLVAMRARPGLPVRLGPLAGLVGRRPGPLQLQASACCSASACR